MGIVIPLFSMREYTFSGSNEVIVHKALDVHQFNSGTVLFRCHSNSITGSNAIKVIVRATSPSIEDPSQDFIYTTSDIAAPGISATTTPPDLVIASLGSDFGSHLQIVVAASFNTGTCKATISADLSLKS